jgi:hypothetical protein
MTKRVALATVVALGAGVLSLVSTTSASAFNNVAVTSSNISAIATVGTMNIGTAANTAGTGAIISPTGSGINASSLGLLQVSNLDASTTANNAQTVVMGTNGKLVLYTALNSSLNAAVFTVTNGTFSSPTLTSDTAVVSYNGSGSAVAIGGYSNAILPAQGTTDVASIVATPISTSLPMVVTGYSAVLSTTNYTAATTALEQTALGTLSSVGTQIGQVTATFTTTSVSGVPSLSNSKPIYTLQAGGTTALTTSAGLEPAGANLITAANPALGTSPWGKVQYGSVILKDAYGVALTAGGIVQASATNGDYVAFSGVSNGTVAAPTSAGTSSSAFTTLASGQTSVGFTVGSATATGHSTTVTLSFNGTVIGAIAYTFTGAVTKLVLSGASNGLVGTTPSTATGQNTFTIKALDSAGNQIAIGSNTSYYPQTLSTVSGNTQGTGISGAAPLYPTTASATVSATGAFNCSASVNAVGSIQYQYVNADGSTIQSNVLALSCSGVPYTYSAKLDKSSYNPGDIATLTVTFKDASGSLAGDSATSVIASSSKLASVTGSFLTPTNGAVSNAAAPSGSATYDNTTNGAAVYKFIVGSTAGSYQAVVDYPLLDANTVAAAQTVAYSIASTGTSLNDVLKGIVSLIASINKQIAALAKLVTKK